MKSQQQATKIYAAYIVGVNAMLGRLNVPVGGDLFIDPAKATWAHVDTIRSFTGTIKGICDMTFNEDNI